MNIERKLSTQTVIIKGNCKINTENLYEKFEITPYIREIKKRGRKNKNDIKIEQKLLDGDIVFIKYKKLSRGTDIKNRKEKKSFRNSLNIIMNMKNKFINIKISNNGSFQMTGIKDILIAEECIKNILNKIYSFEEDIKEYILFNYKENPKFVIGTAMFNVIFDIGFNISKENLDYYINTHTPHNSFLASIYGYTGVNIKMNNNNINESTYKILELINKNWVTKKINYEEYKSLLSESEKTKELNKIRNYTILAFQSGKIILICNNESCVDDPFNKFIDIINKSRDFIEEKIKI